MDESLRPTGITRPAPAPPPQSQTQVHAPKAPASRAVWLKQLHQWHWISSALCLVAMLLFAITGFTLNHAADIESKPRVTARTLQLPTPLVPLLKPAGDAPAPDAAVPPALQDWLAQTLDETLARHGSPEWSEDELYLALPRPGGDAWLRIDRHSGALEYERSDRGWISYFNDLHKGRHVGTAWRLFIDLSALACLVFCITGFLILHHHAAKRASTWPIVGLGLLAPLLLALLLVH